MKSMLLCVLELTIHTFSLVLQNVHIESAIIAPEYFPRMFKVRDIDLDRVNMQFPDLPPPT